MILVIQGQLPHYRREFFNALCALDEVTVVHSGTPSRRTTDSFSELILPRHDLGPFRIQAGLDRLISELRPKTVIAMFDVRWLSTVWAMYKFDRRLNWIWWGLDEGASPLATRAKLAIARRPNPIVFYDRVAQARMSGTVSSPEKLFVANNTFHVDNRARSYLHPVKRRFINVGSLDARKQNDVTIRVLHKICREADGDVVFSLIGEGKELASLKALVARLGFEDRVEFLGKIEDPAELARYYNEALASVSFGQAGLAVLQSMAFGVPFVTKRNAITGGERNNIQDGVTGILCDDSPSSLEEALRMLTTDPTRARALGEAAYDYYSREATVDNMVANFRDAIAYSESVRA